MEKSFLFSRTLSFLSKEKGWATRLAASALEPDGAVVLAPQPTGWVSGVLGYLEGNMTRYFF